jgi:RNA polymerase sigma-70 factor (ECF subfamily)
MALRLEEPVAGTPADFERFYAEYAPRVRAYVRRRMRSANQVDDIVQETFLRAHRNAERFDTTKAVWPWLATIASNLIVDASRLRSSGETPVELRVIDGAQTGADPADHFQASQRRAAISSALGALPSRQRRVLVLRELDGMRYDAVAEQEGLSVDAVKALLKRARVGFRETYSNLASERGLWGIALLPGYALRRAAGRLGPWVDKLADMGGAPVAAAMVATVIGASGIGLFGDAPSSRSIGDRPIVATTAGTAGRLAPVPLPAIGGAGAVLPQTGTARPSVPQGNGGGGALGGAARYGAENNFDATGPDLEQSDHESIDAFGQQLYYHEGWVASDCDKKVIGRQACDALNGVPHNISVGEP